MATARNGIIRELRLMGVKPSSIVISSNIPLRQDGLPYARSATPDDPGVAVYFVRDGEQVCIPCDRWDRVVDNMRAINLTIEAIRGIDRWAAGAVMNAMFDGFAALPAGSGSGDPGWWDVLRVARDAPDQDILRAYRVALVSSHPDHPDGSHDRFLSVQAAWDQARRERGIDG